MWPWEHAAVGYLAYSLGLRALGREPPSDASAVVLAVGTQLPDLVDKPLSWQFDVFPSGYAAGHSLFVAVPLGLLALAVGERRDRLGVAAAFVVGYWSHLLADVVDPLRRGSSVLVGRVLWPVSRPSPYEQDYGISRGVVYIERFLAELQAMPLSAVLIVYLSLPLVTLVVWVLDGSPGLPRPSDFVAVVRRF
jgi:membrane-bound metal-dependent hydrolase YbcI (DUF457 family)